MGRLNSGIMNRYNFFIHAIFLFQLIGFDSVNYAGSGDTKSLRPAYLLQRPRKSLKNDFRRWVPRKSIRVWYHWN